MKYTATLITVSAAIASAQFSINSTTDAITCYGNPNGAYCASDSLSTNIIIRCVNGVGQPGNCNDNLSGYFPYGLEGAECWQSTNTSGDAACAKNCIVECGSGNCGESFTLPNCTPSATQSSTLSTVTSTSVPTTSSAYSNSTTSSSSVTITSTGTSICTTGGTTETITFTTTYCPESSVSTSVVGPTSTPVYTSTIVAPTSSPVYTSSYPLSTGTGSPSSTAASNGTVTKSGSATPVGPTGTTTASPSSYTGAAMSNSAGAGLAAIGLFIAYFL